MHQAGLPSAKLVVQATFIHADGMPGKVQTMTDGLGEFHFPSLPTGEVAVGFLPWYSLVPVTLPEPASIEVLSGQAAHVEFVVPIAD